MERGHVLFREIIVNDQSIMHSFHDCCVLNGRDVRPVRPPVRTIRMFVCGNPNVRISQCGRSRAPIRTFA